MLNQKNIFPYVNMTTINPRIELDIRYATKNNFLGFAVYPKAVCFLHKDVAEALSLVQIDLETRGLSLKIFDGYRPLFIQKLMWDVIQDERYVSNPAKNKGRHTRGTAIDVTIINQAKKELKMPSAFDEFSENAHSNFQDVSNEVRQNRELLKVTMEKHNLIQFSFEWWHFDILGWNNDIKYPPLNYSFEEMENQIIKQNSRK